MGSLAQISSGAIRCSFYTRFWTRFRRVRRFRSKCLVRCKRFGRLWCRYLVRFQRVPEQIPGEVLGRFRKVAVQIRRYGEVPQGSGADTW